MLLDDWHDMFPSPILAATPSGGLLLWIACGLMGAGAFVFAWTIYRTLSSEDLEQEDQWRYDVSRINELRGASLLYRTFQPLIQPLAAANRKLFRDTLPELNRQIQASGICRFWTAEEYLARIEVICLLLLPLYVYLATDLTGPPGVFLACVLMLMTGVLMRKQVAARAAYRLVLIKRRLPYFLDLLTLLMEAGASFLQALEQSVREFRAHAVGVEFGRVLTEMRMGKNRTDSFEAMRDRLQDDELTSLIGAIVQGEELGTPLATLFRSQADILRLKRTQRAETLANEAGVKMLLPAILVMAATVLIILGPFILSFVTSAFVL
jgi:tight adherence protein C